MRRLLAGSVVAAAAVLTAAPAGAQDPVIEIPVDTVVRGDAGSAHEVASVDVDPADVGRECTVTVEGVNNRSKHPDTDIVVSSGDGQVVAEDVEREPGTVTDAVGTLVLGEDVTVTVVLGPDEVFSGGLMVTLECEEPPATTTTTAPEAPAEPAAPATPVVATPTYTG